MKDSRFKFRAWHSDQKEMVYFDNEKITKDQYQAQHLAELIAGHYGDVLMQYIGMKDKNDTDIYDGDILNICFTSDSGKNLHDGIYTAEMNIFKGINFRFQKLLWESYGYNQFPLIIDLSASNSLGNIYSDEKGRTAIYVRDDYVSVTDPNNTYPFNNEKKLSFCSRHFTVIGNIHERPELLSEC